MSDTEIVANSEATHMLILELDYIAVSLRQVEFEAIKRGIEPKGIELTQAAFCRSAMASDHRTAVTDILKAAGNKADAIEKAVGEVDRSVKDFCERTAELNKGVGAMIKAAQRRGVHVAVYSALDDDIALALMDKLGLSELGVELIIPEESSAYFPKADDWLKLLKQSGHEKKTLVAVVSSQVACKGALTAGAACIVVPDTYTAFQDFTGAMFVLDELSNEKPDHILDLTLRVHA